MAPRCPRSCVLNFAYVRMYYLALVRVYQYIYRTSTAVSVRGRDYQLPGTWCDSMRTEPEPTTYVLL